MQETDWTELGCKNVHLMSGTASAIVMRCRAPSRSGYTVKLMKLKLQGPSLARTPSKVLRGALALYSHGLLFNFQKQHILSASGLVLQRRGSDRCLTKVKKAKQSHYRPGQALRVPGC
jgi:hypothetical protein